MRAIVEASWVVYMLPPIDFDWRGHNAINPPLFLEELGTSPPSWALAARELGWEGDITDARIFSTPDEDGFLAGYAWKQGNNGTTFVASQHDLPHLSARAFSETRTDAGLRGASHIENAFALAWSEGDDWTLRGRPLSALGHPLEFQHEILSYRTDFAVPALRIAIELDGLIGHSTPTDIEKDRRRQREIEAKGWRFIRFGGREVVTDASHCVVETYRFLRTLDAQPGEHA